MSFFESEFVKDEIEEITELQDNIYKAVFNFPTMGREEKLEHINTLEKLLNKQHALYTRLCLSDDDEAKKMKEEIIDQAKKLGFPPGVDLGYVFSNMGSIIKNMKLSLDNTST